MANKKRKQEKFLVSHDGELITLSSRTGRTPLIFGFRGRKDKTVIFLTEEEQRDAIRKAIER